jgi:citrate synthase
MAESPESPVNASPPRTRGLEGVVALDTELSFIDGQQGILLYCGYDIRDLARNASFEEVAYLLWKRRLPNQAELDDLNAELQSEREIPDMLIEHLRQHTPREANPMSVLRTATSALGDFDPEADDMSAESNYRKSVRLTAKMPTIVAAFDRIRKGEEPLKPLKTGSLAYDFLYMLNGEEPGERAEDIMDSAMVIQAEHGLNASTFTARVVGSTLSDIYSAVTGALGALKGPLHGGANIQVMQTLLDLDASGEDPGEFVRRKLAAREKIMGIGHRVYRTVDPRAIILGEMLEGLSREKGEMKWYEMSNTIRDIVLEEKGLNPNVDFYSASVYYLLGIERDLYTPIFAISRIIGWTAHLLEQWEDNRLIRPRAGYIGQRDLTVVPIEDR